MATIDVERQEIDAFVIRKEIEIDAPTNIAFEAVLEELGPAAQMPDGTTLAMKFEPWPGGRWYRDLGNNAGHLWGHVQVIKPPVLIEITGPMPMSYPAINHVQYRLKETKGGKTLLTFVHRAMGLIQPEHRDGMPAGWQHWLEQIRDLAEQKARRR
ncbi:MAG: SRPBCC domain-containing protein [Planctomycetota bacterium]